MNPFILAPEERLDHWKEFRRSLPSLTEEEQLRAVAKYWAYAPLGKMVHDIEQPQELPTPWEMISDGNWDKNTVAIGMEFTLRLAGWNTDRLQLQLIKDDDISDVILILIVDDSLVLNYDYSEVTNYPETNITVMGKWRFSGKTYTPISL